MEFYWLLLCCGCTIALSVGVVIGYKIARCHGALVESVEAVRLVVIIAMFGGVVFGVAARVYANRVKSTAIATAAGVAELETEVARLRVECAPPILDPPCAGDPIGGPCALSWKRVLREKKFTWHFSSCGDRWSGRFDWTSVHDIDPSDPVVLKFRAVEAEL